MNNNYMGASLLIARNYCLLKNIYISDRDYQNYHTIVYVARALYICDRICQKGSYTRNIEKSRFEILNTVYLENAWCLIYEILHQSIVIQGNSVGVLFDGLLAELPAILDSFFHQYHK